MLVCSEVKLQEDFLVPRVRLEQKLTEEEVNTLCKAIRETERPGKGHKRRYYFDKALKSLPVDSTLRKKFDRYLRLIPPSPIKYRPVPIGPLRP